MHRTSKRKPYRIYQRPGTPFWHVSYTVDGRRFRYSLGTDDEDVAHIKAADDHRKALIGHITGEKDEIDLDHAIGRYVMEIARFQASFQTTKHQSKALLRIIGRPTRLSSIDDRAVSAFVAKRRGENARRGKSPRKGRGSVKMDRLVGNATVNREVQLLRRIMNKATSEEWGYAVGKVEWKRHLLQESDGNTRWLTAAQVDRIMAVSLEHMKGPLVAAICTGLRAENVMRLDWSEIDLQARMITVRIKSRQPGGRELAVPIAGPLFNVLVKLGPKDAGRVFLYRGRPMKTDVRHAWLTALKNAGIGRHYTWHDLRHTAASWMRQRKVPLDIVQKILGHRYISSTERYAHIGEDSAAEAVTAIADTLGTPVAQRELKKAANDR